jgi:hypothetical protein
MTVRETLDLSISTYAYVIPVLQAHLASQDGNARETPLRTSTSVLQTPAASPPKGRGSSRLLTAQKRDYASLTGAESRKRRKRRIPQRSEKCADEPSLGCTAAEKTIEGGSQCSNHEVGRSCPSSKSVSMLGLRFTFLLSSPCLTANM